MKHPNITKDEIFTSFDYFDCAKPFLESFPDMPDPYQGHGLQGALNCGIGSFMTDKGVLYYLPLFTKFLLENPLEGFLWES